MEVNKPKRLLTDADVLKYDPMVEMFLRDKCMKNWSEARTGNPEAFLGSSGYSLNDIRQHLRTEICVALQNYNPAYVTKEGKSVKESTFVYQHLTFRVGQMMKRLTKRRQGYGIRHSPFDLLIRSGVQEESVLDLDLANAIDGARDLKRSKWSQVQLFLEKNHEY
jgi:hypothetical protein